MHNNKTNKEITKTKEQGLSQNGLDRNDLTKGDPFKVLWRFALPVIGGNIFQLFYTLADSVIVGKTLGAQALAAVGSTSIIIYFVLCFIQGFTNGFGICLGRYFGAKDTVKMKKSIAVSTLLCIGFTLLITVLCCGLSASILHWMQTPEDIFSLAYSYMFVVLLGTGATVFYNMVSNILRALGDSKTPLYFLVFSSLLNVVLDVVFIVPFSMGIAGAAWATVLSQLISGICCLVAGLRKFEIMHLHKADFRHLAPDAAEHLKIGFPMGFQMSVMCIGQLAMQAAVNALGSVAVAGYTAATKADQMSVLVNNAMGTAISNYVAQNYGAGDLARIKAGVRACLIQTEGLNLLMGIIMLLFRRQIVELFISNPSPEMIAYSNGYINVVAPCYLILGLLLTYRTAIQSMQNTIAPFSACMIELVMRIAATMILTNLVGYLGVCVASPMAWIGACALLIPVYYHVIRKAAIQGLH